MTGDDSEKNKIAYCFKFQSFLENLYTHEQIEIPSFRKKDYISTPKKNGYQSLHLSCVTSYGRKFEVQIRTSEMEDVAKYGNANHSEKYKPRKLDKRPLLKVPHYKIIRSENGKPVFHKLSLEENFQYFYNIPYTVYQVLRETAQAEEQK